MVPQPVLVTWLFAAWWLYVAIRDSTNPRSKRYANVPSILASLANVAILTWLGFLLLWQARAWVVVALALFALMWIVWMAVSLGRRGP
jgi:hypothetical protein